MNLTHFVRILTAAITAGLMASASAEAADAFTASPAAEVTPDSGSGDQRWPTLAAGKDCYLAVWQEGLAGYGNKQTKIMAARISAEGKTLDPKGIVVCDAQGVREYPVVTFDGTGFVVAWQDFRNGADWDICVARISADGKVLDPGGVVAVYGTGNQIYPELASDCNGQALLVWSDLRPHPGKPELYSLTCSIVKDGKLATPEGREIVSHGGKGNWLDCRVVWDGEFYYILGIMAPVNNMPFPSLGTGYYSVAADGKPQGACKGPVSFSYSFAIAADQAGKRQFTWSNRHYGHGEYMMFYSSAVAKSRQPAGNALALGFNWQFHPRVELLCAATFDGKNFVAVQEHTGQEKAPYNFDLIATRADPDKGDVLDLTTSHETFSDPECEKHVKECWGKEPSGLKAAAEPVNERQPALASLGGGKSLLIYSRHGGVDKYRLQATLLSE